jgi:phage terminase large subunit
LLIRRSYPELKGNHLLPFLREYGAMVTYAEGEKRLSFQNGSVIELGYCADDGDALRYQGQEYDVIAIDEATQLSEFRFSIFKACLRGTGNYPRRMYLTCNPGGIGHGWVKRLFIDRNYRTGERSEDYCFISASVYDNGVLLEKDPEYVRMLESLPPRMRDAWLYGRWDVFDGQFFPEFNEELHVVEPSRVPTRLRRFVAFDYGLDMLAALLIGIDGSGTLWVLREFCAPGLRLSEAASAVVRLIDGEAVDYAVASPDLWNRRQDSGRSGFEIMQSVRGMPPMRPADDRRIPGWRLVREYLCRPTGGGEDGGAEESRERLYIVRGCTELIRSMPLLLSDPNRPEDASGEPHAVTHAPEALRYGVMSRAQPPGRESMPFRFASNRRETYF